MLLLDAPLRLRELLGERVAGALGLLHFLQSAIPIFGQLRRFLGGQLAGSAHLREFLLPSIHARLHVSTDARGQFELFSCPLHAALQVLLLRKLLSQLRLQLSSFFSQLLLCRARLSHLLILLSQLGFQFRNFLVSLLRKGSLQLIQLLALLCQTVQFSLKLRFGLFEFLELRLRTLDARLSLCERLLRPLGLGPLLRERGLSSLGSLLGRLPRLLGLLELRLHG
mmetsp:Transcript_36198/g.91107  ORF Transcript_36198/g.91107 Transcript_36198/m.91107 type:complete len:225 (+) Transcript_36198:1538-2212(+)